MRPLAAISLILLLGSETACSAGTSAVLAPCHHDAVSTSPGIILALASGQTYQVYPTDNHISMNWLPADRLVVCPIGGTAVRITDVSEKGETVQAVRIFNLGWYIWPLW